MEGRAIPARKAPATGVRPLSTRLWSFNESALYGRLDETPGRKRNAITEASTSGSSPFDQGHTNTARVETSDAIRYKEHPWKHLHAASLTLSWAVASDMID